MSDSAIEYVWKIHGNSTAGLVSAIHHVSSRWEGWLFLRSSTLLYDVAASPTAASQMQRNIYQRFTGMAARHERRRIFSGEIVAAKNATIPTLTLPVGQKSEISTMKVDVGSLTSSF